MAVNIVTLDSATRVQIMLNTSTPRGTVAFEMPYDRVTIDGTTYWEPLAGSGAVTEKGVMQRGFYTGTEYVSGRNAAFPVARQGDASQVAVWMFPGI